MSFCRNNNLARCFKNDLQSAATGIVVGDAGVNLNDQSLYPAQFFGRML
jgi:hypothetical protein